MLQGRPAPAVDVHYTKGRSARDIPFDSAGGKITFKTLVNGSGPYSFILDTGIQTTALDLSVAKSLGLRVDRTFQIGGAGAGTVTAAKGAAYEVSLPGLHYTAKGGWMADLNKVMRSPEGHAVDGLIGGEMFVPAVVQVDYQHKMLSFFDPATYHHEGKGAVVPIEVKFKSMYVKASFELAGQKLNGTFLIDTGDRLAITLNTPFVRAHHLMTPDTPKMVVGSGLGGMVEHGVARLTSLSLNGVQVGSPFVTLSMDQKGAFASDDIDGLIGADVLKNFKVTIDYPDQRLYLDPAGKPSYSFDASGMFLESTGKDLKTVLVASSSSSMPAGKAGIKTGDLLLKIDGKDVSSMTLEEVRSNLRRDGKTAVLVLSRDGKTYNVNLKLRYPG